MMYMFLLFSNPDLPQPPNVMEQHASVEGPTRASGADIASEALTLGDRATTVRMRDGKAIVTHGPFAETKEVLGGFYIIDCKDLEEALGYAKRIPDAQFGAVEVRPLMGNADQPWDYATHNRDRERTPWPK